MNSLHSSMAAVTALIASSVFALPAVASTELRSLTCQSRGDQAIVFNSIKVEASLIQKGFMKDVVVTTATEGYGEKPEDKIQISIGRAQQLAAVAKYAPRKYKNHERFDLSELTETIDFSKFMPGDTCELNLLLPVDASTQNSFEAPMVIHCDQNGGSVTLDCKTDVWRR